MRPVALVVSLTVSGCGQLGGDPATKGTASAQAAVHPAPPASTSPASTPPVATSDAPAAARASVATDTPDAPCGEVLGAAIYASPRVPVAGRPVRWMAVSDRPLDAALVVRGPNGDVVARSAERRGGPPYWWLVEVPIAASGEHRASMAGKLSRAPCARVDVAPEPPPLARRTPVVWPIARDWTRADEMFFSAWIEKLFDDPLDAQPSWPALHEVLRQRTRNVLHDHLGLGEDDDGPTGLIVDPDCADLPYFLRAYFAFKLGLPFGYSACTRGGGGSAPRCIRWHHNLQPAARGRHPSPGPAGPFGHFLRVSVADTVHSGSGRTLADDDRTDFYPVPLTAESLRPGTIYADPYGHVLVVVRRIPETSDSSGILLAVDGQPDGTIARRRFWRGNFLYATDPALGGPGFKRFRPVVRDGARLRTLDNSEITAHPAYGDYDPTPSSLDVEAFYDRMDDVLSPAPMDPARVLRETIQALEEQVKGRVTSVNNGVKHLAAHPETIDMPDGPAIFETTGPWEDFSTPSRDLRLLIAIDVVKNLPARVARRPERFAVSRNDSPEAIKAGLEALLATELSKRKFSYPRSDGSEVELTLADVVARAKELEVAYNPNDCPEVRWGAPPKSVEASTCRRRAPADQRARMERIRDWFRERRRPPR